MDNVAGKDISQYNHARIFPKSMFASCILSGMSSQSCSKLSSADRHDSHRKRKRHTHTSLVGSSGAWSTIFDDVRTGNNNHTCLSMARSWLFKKRLWSTSSTFMGTRRIFESNRPHQGAQS